MQWAACQCLWFLEQRLLGKCKHLFIAVRNFVICVPTPRQGKGNQVITYTAGRTSGATLVLLAGFLQWVHGAQTGKKGGREGGETATTEGWRERS